MPLTAQRFDSRQSMQNKHFEVFHYRDMKPEVVALHHHDFYEIYYFLSGQVDFRIEGRSYHLQPGDLLLINPMELHRPEIGLKTLYDRIVIWVDKSFLTSLSSETLDLAACFDTGTPHHTNLLRPNKIKRNMLEQLLFRLNKEYYSSEYASSAYAQGLLLQILAELNRLANEAEDRSAIHESPTLVTRALMYINTHYQENITLDQLAQMFFVSKYYLSHEFSNQVGTSIHRYLIFRRLMRANELIRSGEPPARVYQACGFGDYANFYRAFKTEYGISPSAFAASVQEENEK